QIIHVRPSLPGPPSFVRRAPPPTLLLRLAFSAPIRTRLGSMFPDKAKMVRNANAILLVLAVAPLVYLATAAPLTFKGGLARDQSIVPCLFYILVIVSLANIATIVFFQTSKSIMSERGRYDPVGRTYLVM